MIGGEPSKPIMYNLETLKKEIIDFSINNYSIRNKFCTYYPQSTRWTCIGLTEYDKIKEHAYDKYKNNLCIFAEYSNTDTNVIIDKIHYGILVTNQNNFDKYGIDTTYIEFKGSTLYDKTKLESIYEPRPDSTNIFRVTRGDGQILMGFIDKKYESDVKAQAKEIRANVRKERKIN